MHLFDQQRPRLSNGLPQFIAPSGGPAGGVCQPIVCLREDGSVDLMFYVPTGGSGFSAKYKRGIELTQVGDELEAFASDPEAYITALGWEFNPSARAAQFEPAHAGEVKSAEDLGL
jgi:hypothetical protein